MPLLAPPTVLIVEDHAPTRRFLADNLCADGYEPIEAATLAAAQLRLAGDPPSLALLDLQLSDGDGLELLDSLRGDGEAGGPLAADLPVLVLSGRDSELDRVRGLRRGADDYLVKLFAYPELLARVEALLRRSRPRRSARLRIGTLELDLDARQAWLAGTPVHLSGKEFALLRMLAGEPTRTFTREELLREVWGFKSQGATRTLDTHAYRLRHKLVGGRPSFVVNVWGVGYRLCDGEAGS